jgi:hypothetical protein
MPDITEGIWRVDPPDENLYPEGRLIWLVSRQDVIFPDGEFKKKMKFTFESDQWGKTAVITFVADGGDKVPSKLEDMSPNGKCIVLGLLADIGFRSSSALSSELTNWLVIGHNIIVNIPVRMDGLLRSDFTKRTVIKGRFRLKYYEISIDVEMSIKRAVTVDVKHQNRVIATYTTTSL